MHANTKLETILNNSIVSQNTGQESPDFNFTSGTLNGAFNLIGDGTGQTLVHGTDGNLVGTAESPIDPILSEWTQFDNGRWGYYLLPMSPALDAGDSQLALDSLGQPLIVDFYGNDRISGNAVDIGAIEGANSYSLSSQVYKVTSLENQIAEDGILTFIEAFQAANRNQNVGDATAGSFTESDVIQFADGLSGTILVSQDDLEITSSLRIEGPGVDCLTFDASEYNRIFDIAPGTDVNLSGITIANGLADRGGGIFNGGNLSIANVSFVFNSAESGGAVYSIGDMAISDSFLGENSATKSSGGAIYAIGKELIITNTEILNNFSEKYGGGVSSNSKNLIFSNSTISSNQTNGSGGGIYIASTSGIVEVINSAITQNISTNDGGGIYSYSDFAIIGSRISENVSYGAGGGVFSRENIYSSGNVEITNSIFARNLSSSKGSGIYNSRGDLTITNSSFLSNSASAIYSGYSTSVVTLNNSMVANNGGSNGTDILIGNSTLVGVNNLIGNGANQPLVDGTDGNMVGTSDAPLDPGLSDWTMLPNGEWGYYLLPNSLALDAGDTQVAVDAEGQPLLNDIYGNARIVGDSVDIGAIEGATGGVPALTYIVTSLENTIAEDGILTFIEAFQAANQNQPVGDASAGSFSEQDTIRFADGLIGTIVVDEGELELCGDLRIEGTRAEQIVFDANGQNRIFNVQSGVAFDLSGVTITGGYSTENGGGINGFYSDITVANVTITGNQTNRYGGGISNRFGTLLVTGCSISENSSNQGGGIWNEVGTATIVNSTIAQNIAPYGGGIYEYRGSTTVVNSMIAKNYASYGGGVRNVAGNLLITNSTISGNSAIIRGGGIDSAGSTAPTVNLNNTIVAKNISPEGTDICLENTTYTGSHNLIGDGSEQALTNGVDGNLVGSFENPIDPLLSDWTQLDNGQWGYYLLPGSPALDAGSTELALDPDGHPLTEDIYGNARVVGSTVDIGAVEGITSGTSAQTYVVASLENTIANDGVLTFIEAFEAANRNQPIGDAPAGSFIEQDIIQFVDGLGGTILVDQGQLDILGSLRIEGPGSDQLTFDAAGKNRVFYLHTGIEVDLSGMTITGGSSTADGGGISNKSNSLTLQNVAITENCSENYGGGIYSFASNVTISHSQLVDNVSYRTGGGICNKNSALILNDSTITNNSANTSGGGISDLESTLSVSNSTFSGNTTQRSGGAIYHDSRQLSVQNSSFLNNHAESGGAIYDKSGGSYNQQNITDSTIIGSMFLNNVADTGGGLYSSAEMRIVDSTFAYNHATESGGGIYSSANLTLLNSTVSGNETDGSGGGIYATYTTNIINSTIVCNSADYAGGIYRNSGYLNVDNSVVAGNITESNYPDIYYYCPPYSTVTLQAKNSLIGNGYKLDSVTNGVDGNIVGSPEEPVDPMLGPLQDNGGLTLTHAPLTGSPLIDAGDDTLAIDHRGRPLTTDQRGCYRYYGNVDIGAVESQPIGLPFAYDDFFMLNQGSSITIEPQELLKNDVCDNGSPLSVTVADGPKYGTLATKPDGTMIYTPEAAFWGTDSFTYKAINTSTSLESNVVKVILSVISPQSVIVTTVQDERDGNLSPDDISLREALVDLNATQIQFSTELENFEICLTLGTLDISNVQIVGLGRQQLIINGNDELTAFYVTGEATIVSDLMVTGCAGTAGVSVATDGSLLLENAWIYRNKAGGILNEGDLTVTNSIISGNTGENGAGIYSYATEGDPTLMIIDSEILNNTGLGIYAQSGVTTISNSTISNNFALKDNMSSGGIANYATMAIIDSTLSGNSGSYGGRSINNIGIMKITGTIISQNKFGGVHNNGELTIANSTIADNAANCGGGVYNSHGILKITNSTLSGNTVSDAYASGGGIYNKDGTVTIINSTFSGNSASSNLAYGGGIYNDRGTITLVGSTLWGNSAKSGGGIYSSDGTFNLFCCTISGNDAEQGGGIAKANGKLTITNSTITNNIASNSGGGVCIIGSSKLNALYNTAVAGNSGQESPDACGVFLGYNNLIGDGTGISELINGTDGNIVGAAENPIAPMLGPLQDNGGPTLTCAPLTDSPLIDAGDISMATDERGFSLLTDQRGYTRQFEAVDIGAVEIQPAGVPVAYHDSFDLLRGTSLTLTSQELLANDVCNDGSILAIEILDSPKHGTLTNAPNGTLIYTPLASFEGVDFVTYKAINQSNSLESNIGKVIFSVLSPKSVVVTVLDDEQDGNLTTDDISLREAIVDLAATQIQFSARLFNQEISLTKGTLEISDVQIIGLGIDYLTISGNQSNTVFSVKAGTSAVSRLKITGCTDAIAVTVDQGATLLLAETWISDNNVGGILNNGNISVVSSSIINNSAKEYGGGIYNNGTLTITDSIISNNFSKSRGGGIYNTGLLTITNSAISENSTSSSSSQGGGIYNTGILKLESSTINNNSARYGAGIFNLGSGIIKASTISGNTSSDEGGGIFNSDATATTTLTIQNTDIRGNYANSYGGGIYYSTSKAASSFNLINSTVSCNKANSRGGGIYYRTFGNTTIANIKSSTIAGNKAGRGGGVYFISSQTTTLTLDNTIVALNETADGSDIYLDDNNAKITGSHNLIGNETGQTFVNDTDGNLVGSSAEPLDPLFVSNPSLDDPTTTDLSLLPNSPAVNAGNNSLAVDETGATLLWDMRGEPHDRVLGGTINIGAYENEIAGNETFSETINHSINGTVSANDSPPLNGTITLVNDVSNGILTLNTDGTFVYTPNTDFVGLESFTYKYVSPTTETNTATVTLYIFSDGPFVVTTKDDELDFTYDLNDISLREALWLANLREGDDTIEFASALSDQRITLDPNLGQLTIDSNVSITSTKPITIDAQEQCRVLFVEENVTATIDGLIITGGSSSTGGGIHNSGNLTINNSQLLDNYASSSGGAVYNNGRDETAILTITNSTISGNIGRYFGGGIQNYGGYLEIINCSITENQAYGGSSGSGGGISNFSGYNNNEIATTVIIGSTISNNLAKYDGGAIFSDGRNGEVAVVIQNSTVSHNNANDDGGAIFNIGNNDDATLTLTNSSIMNNSAQNYGAILNIVGSIYISPGDNPVVRLNATNCTIVGNSATLSGGGIGGSHSYIVLNNTIVAKNTAPEDLDFDLYATSVTGAHNLIGTGALANGTNGNIGGTAENPLDPMLDGQGRPLPNSPVIDAGSDALAISYNGSTLLYDIEGDPRVRYDCVDIGAYEYYNCNITVDAGGPYVVNEGSSVLLDASGSTNLVYDFVSYEWDFDGDGQFDDASGEIVYFSSPQDGIYNVVVKVTDTSGAWDTGNTTITVDNVAPTADAGAPFAVNEGSSFALNAAGSTDPGNDIVSYEWDLDGDNQYDDASGQNINWNITQSGNYLVGLKVTDANGVSSTDSVAVTINNVAPIADAGSSYMVDEGKTLLLDASGSTDPGKDIVSYAWDFDNDGQYDAFGVEVNFTPPSVDNYTVLLRVTDSDGAVGIDSATVTVGRTKPIANAGGPYLGNEGDIITLDASGSIIPSGDTLTYAWDFDGDGQYDDAFGVIVDFNPLSSGSYTVSLQVTDDDGEIDTEITEVKLNNIAPMANAGGSYGTREGLPVTFDASGSTDPGNDIVSYAWDFDGDAEYDDAFGVTVDFNPTHSGDQTVSVKVTDNDGDFDTADAQIAVRNIKPTANAGGPYTCIADELLTLDASASTDPGNDIVSYEWDFNSDAIYDDAKGAVVQFPTSTAGTFVAAVKVTDDDGASSVALALVTIQEKPVQDWGTVRLNLRDLNDTKDIDWLDEWSGCWIEVWATGTANNAIDSFDVELAFEADCFTPELAMVQPGEKINTETLNVTLNESTGNLQVAGATLTNNAGQGSEVLLAKLAFKPVSGESVLPRDTDGKYLEPVADAGFQLVQAELTAPNVSTISTATIAAQDDTPLWPVMYDLDGNSVIDLLDVAQMLAVFQWRAEENAPPMVWASDFDHSGTVDLLDVAEMLARFQYRKGNGNSVTYPADFPFASPENHADATAKNHTYNDAALAESKWNDLDITAIAKDLTPVSAKKLTAASDELFELELDLYVDLE